VEEMAARWARIVTVPMEHGVQGAYDADTDTILISSGLTDVQRRRVLAHEVSHARHRDRGCVAPGSPVERRADREAARLLVDPRGYAVAERVCDNVWWLARELDVMPWIINAYRELVHEFPCILYDGKVKI
jgi:Zn-dependent peptidase ImmA (M78 family)